MRNYKKEYQNRIKNKKELRCYIDLNTYNIFKNKLVMDNLNFNSWTKKQIIEYLNKGDE